MGGAGKLVGKVRNAHTPGDLWHLSIDDLLKPPGNDTEPAGPGPFVINLSTSTATIPAPPARMPRFEGLRVYQLQRPQEGRGVQFRLRLGIIQSALEADAILERVREHYPGATLETVGEEDEAAFAAAKAADAPKERAAPAAGGAPTNAPTAQAKQPDAARGAAAKGPDAAGVGGGNATPKAPASVLPEVPLEPVGNVRWDIDELLPDLPVTRPSKSRLPPSPSAAAGARKGKSPDAASARESTQARGAHGRKGGGALRSPPAPQGSPEASGSAHPKNASRGASAPSGTRSSATSHAPTSNAAPRASATSHAPAGNTAPRSSATSPAATGSGASRATASPSKPAPPAKAGGRPRKPSRDSLETTLDISATTADITIEVCLPALERTQEIAPIEISPEAPQPAPASRAKRSRAPDAPAARPAAEASAPVPEFTLEIEEVLGPLPTVVPDPKPSIVEPCLEELASAAEGVSAEASRQLAEAVRDLEAFAPPAAKPPRVEAPRRAAHAMPARSPAPLAAEPPRIEAAPPTSSMRDAVPLAAPIAEPPRIESSLPATNSMRGDVLRAAPIAEPSPRIDSSPRATHSMRDITRQAPAPAESARVDAARSAEISPQIGVSRSAPAFAVESSTEAQVTDATPATPVDAPSSEVAKDAGPPLAEAAVDALLSASIEPEPPVLASSLDKSPPEVSPPAPPAPEPPVDDDNFDYDSNADTVEVEALVMFDAPLDLSDAPALAEGAADVVPSFSSEGEVVLELEFVDPSVLETPPAFARAPDLVAAAVEPQATAHLAESMPVARAADERHATGTEQGPDSGGRADDLTVEAAALVESTASAESAALVGDSQAHAESLPLADAASADAEDPTLAANALSDSEAPALAAHLLSDLEGQTLASTTESTIDDAAATHEVATESISDSAAQALLLAVEAGPADADRELAAAESPSDDHADALEIGALLMEERDPTAAAVANTDLAADAELARAPALDVDALPIAQPVADAPDVEAQSTVSLGDEEVPAGPAATALPVVETHAIAATADTDAPPSAAVPVIEALATESPATESSATEAALSLEEACSAKPIAADADAPTAADLDDGSVTIEAPIFWNDTPPVIEVATDSSERELGPDSLTIEAPAFRRDSPADGREHERAHASSVTLEVLALSTESSSLGPPLSEDGASATEAHEMAALAAAIAAQLAEESLPQSAKPEVADSAPPLTLALEEIAVSPAESLPPKAELELVADPPEVGTPSTAAAAPAESNGKDDSQSLEGLVAKIGALIETAEAHDADTPGDKATAPDALELSTSSGDELPALRLLSDDESPSLASPAPAPGPASAMPSLASESASTGAPFEAMAPDSSSAPSPAAEAQAPAEASRAQASSSAAAKSPAVTSREAPNAKRAPSQSMWPAPSQSKNAARASAAHSEAVPGRGAEKSKRASNTPAHGAASPAAQSSAPPATTPAAPPARSSAPPATTPAAAARTSAPRATPSFAPPSTRAAPPPAAANHAASTTARTGPSIASEPETPAFDSTQTVRALTPLELQDGQASKSYAIQLVLSEDPILPEHIPNLDIFEAYRLYVVIGLFEDRVMHALRLGFFTSDVAAEAVAGYLKSYFETPEIKRVSLAEHERFQERRVAARKDVGATGTHKSIELASRPELPERRARVEVAAAKQSTPSLWARLLKR